MLRYQATKSSHVLRWLCQASHAAGCIEGLSRSCSLAISSCTANISIKHLPQHFQLPVNYRTLRLKFTIFAIVIDIFPGILAPARAKQTLARHAIPSQTLKKHVLNAATNAMPMRAQQPSPATSTACNISVQIKPVVRVSSTSAPPMQRRDKTQ